MQAKSYFSSLLVMAALVPASLHAADAQGEKRLREALRASQGQLGALEDERVRSQSTQAAQKKELESLRAQLASAKRKTRESSRSQTLALRVDELTEANRKLSESLAQSQAAARDAAEQARSKDEQRAQLAAEVSSLSTRATSCESKNARLYRLTHELLDRYQNMGAGEAIARLEPLLGFKRVEAENFSQEFEDQILEQKVKR